MSIFSVVAVFSTALGVEDCMLHMLRAARSAPIIISQHRCTEVKEDDPCFAGRQTLLLDAWLNGWTEDWSPSTLRELQLAWLA